MKKISDLIYSLGAAVVIFGAWAKIEHKPFADVMLTIGLITEAGLFCFMGVADWFSKKPVPETSEKLIISGGSDNTELTSAVKDLTGTIKNVFKTA